MRQASLWRHARIVIIRSRSEEIVVALSVPRAMEMAGIMTPFVTGWILATCSCPPSTACRQPIMAVTRQ
jgi:hypothetical protein